MKMKHKRIVLVGPTCAGKTFIRDKFRDKGYKIDVSYTSRSPRENEKDGIDYHFITKKEFESNIKNNLFYEWVRYGDNYYGTGKFEWENSDVFIMETSGIKKIWLEDRENTVVILVTTPYVIRYDRMKCRGWDDKKIEERVQVDNQKFENFKDYDIEMQSYETFI